MRAPLTRVPRSQFRSYASEGKKPSEMAIFYKTFTRPVLKVLLMALVTYQIAYLGWMKLEQDELKSERTQLVDSLEAKVEELQRQQKEKK